MTETPTGNVPPPRLVPPPRGGAPARRAPLRAEGAGPGLLAMLLVGVALVGAVFAVAVLPRLVGRERPEGASPPNAEQGSATDPTAKPAGGPNDPTGAEVSLALPQQAPTASATPSEGSEPDPGPAANVASSTLPSATRPGAAPSSSTGNPEPATATKAPPAGFAEAMTAGHDALERGAFDEARAAFIQAAALVPGSTPAAEGLARADEARRSAQLQLRLAEARSAEGNEDWALARKAFDAALSLDPTVMEAQQGRGRAEARAALAERMTFHITNTQRLGTPEVYAEAEKLLAAAREVHPRGPRHAEQVVRLERALAGALVPVPVALNSDGLTSVQVLRHGQMGRFTEKHLALVPGTYTVVGSRPGYRDVRVRLEVEAGRPPAPLTIRCTEAVKP